MKRKMQSSTMRRLVSIGLVVVIALIFIIITDDFLMQRNIFLLLKDSAYLGLIAVGMAVVMIGGGIDLSVAGNVCFVGIIAVRMSLAGLSGYVVLLIAILMGAALGFVNGIVVSKIGITEFVCTLATGFLYSGLGLLFAIKSSSGAIITLPISSPTFLQFGKSLWTGGLYPITIFWVIIAVAMFFVLRKTKFGLHTYAMGSNRKSAAMSGVNPVFVKTAGFMISGAICGLTSFLVVANFTSANTTLGTGYDFQAIAACVVGGIALQGGKGDTLNSMLGALFMILIMNGIYKLGLDPLWNYIFQGGIIILACSFDAQFAKMAKARRMKEFRVTQPADTGEAQAGKGA
jgi:ribose transport system permease protein